MKAAIAALGGDPDRLEIPIMQFVHVVEGGERASMSKRRGDFVTLDDLIDEIGVDATRFFMLSARTTRRSTSTSTSRASSPTRTPSTTCSTRTPASPRCCAKAGEERVAAALGGRRAAGRRCTRPSAS